MRTILNDTINSIMDAIAIFQSDAITWKTKYDLIFSIHATIINPNLKKLNLSLDLYNPDTSYQEDVMAYVRAIEEMEKELVAVRSVLVDIQSANDDANSL